jgi:hypothetical protein
MTYKRPARPKSAYESGKASLAHSWIAERSDEWLNGQLQLTSKLAVANQYQAGRLAAIREELSRRSKTR